jgi:hypothetical protein
MSGLGTKSSGEGAEGILLGIVITGKEGKKIFVPLGGFV